MKRLVFLAALAVVGTAGAEPAPVAISSGTADAVVAVARDRNPALLAARHAWRAAGFRGAAAGAWPDPSLIFEDEKFDAAAPGVEGEHVRRYGVSQAIPFPGKRSADARMKHHEAMIAEASYRAKWNEVTGEARMRTYQLFLTDQKIELAERTAAALKSVLQTAQARLASGQSSTSDVFLAQMELRKMENALYQQRQEREKAEIELNALLDQPTDTAWGAVAPAALTDVPATLHDLIQAARRQAPQVWAAEHERRHAETMLRRARLDFAPDVSVSYEKERTVDGPDGRQIGVGASFPLWLQRPWSLNREARAHLAETEAMAHDREAEVLRMVHLEYNETTTHLTLARNYERDILPLAQSNLNVAREQYASGRGDFLRVLEALRGWIDAHNEFQNELYHYGEHWSLLERWSGTDLVAGGPLAPPSGQGASHAH